MKRTHQSRHSILISLWCALCCCVLAPGCYDNNPVDFDENGRLDATRFPLAVGNQWTYHVDGRTVEMHSNPPDTKVTPIDVDVVWKITAKEKEWIFDFFEMETTYHVLSGRDSSKTYTMLTWFVELGDTLIGAASGPPTGMNPIGAFLFKPAEDPEEEEPEEENRSSWGADVLVFPLEVGKEWQYYRPDDPSHPRLGKKLVEAVEPMTVPAGRFKTARIVRSLVFDYPHSTGHYRMTQWYSSIGMVKYIEHQDGEETHPVYDTEGNSIGEDILSFTSDYTMNLMGYHIGE